MQRPINVRFLVIRSPLALCPDSHVWCGRECPPDLCGSWVWLKGKAARAGSGVGVTAEILSTGTTGPPSLPKVRCPAASGQTNADDVGHKSQTGAHTRKGRVENCPKGAPLYRGGGGAGQGPLVSGALTLAVFLAKIFCNLFHQKGGGGANDHFSTPPHTTPHPFLLIHFLMTSANKVTLPPKCATTCQMTKGNSRVHNKVCAMKNVSMMFSN